MPFFLLQGSRDNMSIVLVVFPGAPTPSEEARKREEELHESIEIRMKGCFNFTNCENLL